MRFGGRPLREAVREVVFEELPALNGEGGVIAIDREGNIAMPFNTSGMYRAYIDAKGYAVVEIYKE